MVISMLLFECEQRFPHFIVIQLPEDIGNILNLYLFERKAETMRSM